jgi:hypothetical protein
MKAVLRLWNVEEWVRGCLREEIRVKRLLDFATASTRWTRWSSSIIVARKLGPAAWQILPRYKLVVVPEQKKSIRPCLGV